MDTKQLPSPSSPAPAEQLPAYSAAPAMTDIIPDIIPLRAVAAPPSREHLRRAMAFALAMPFGTLFLLVGMGCVAVSFSEVDGCDGDDWCEVGLLLPADGRDGADALFPGRWVLLRRVPARRRRCRPAGALHLHHVPAHPGGPQRGRAGDGGRRGGRERVPGRSR
ncbi:hypothetical protein DFJ74DRAFT_667662 [Hyaloraphidium curvatum]|nr:hypothetical protein DFJ74DRAFT_667662 [Hyaloraphidium curvatum]